MTIADTSMKGARPRFGVFARLGEVFSLIFRRRPGAFLGVGLLLVLGLPVAVGAALIGLLEVFDPDLTLADTSAEAAVAAVAGFLALLIWLFAAGVMTLVGCDEMAGRRRNLGAYFRQSAKRLPIVFPLGLLASLAVMAGSFLIGIAGLWAAAVYSVFMPALLWEGAGWRALGRSRRLTKEYRWPIMGLIFLLYLALIVLLVAISVGTAAISSENEVVFAVLGLLPFVMQVLFVPIFCAVPPVVHARLLAIKEGGTNAELRAVFE